MACFTLGCDDATAPSGDRFALESAEGPVALLLGGDVVVTDGSLELVGDDRVVQRLSLGCAAETPGCSPPAEWARMEGAVGAVVGAPGDPRLVAWTGAGESLLRVDADTAWVSHPLPPSQGLGTVVFRFER